jgi:hypothetical protein
MRMRMRIRMMMMICVLRGVGLDPFSRVPFLVPWKPCLADPLADVLVGEAVDEDRHVEQYFPI